MRRSRATLLATLAAFASGWDSSSRMIWSEPLADPATATAAPSAAAPNDHGVTPHVRKIVDKMLRMKPDPSETMNSFQKFATSANVDLATARRFEPIEASVRMHSDSMAMMAGYLTSVKVKAASTDGDPEGDPEGDSVGPTEGAADGPAEGPAVGAAEGAAEGAGPAGTMR